MANKSKQKRDQMIGFLNELKREHSDVPSIKAFNEIENYIQEKKYGLVWETHEEQVDVILRDNIPVFSEDSQRQLIKNPAFPYHFLIEGDNLQALYLLEKTHKNAIDVIYIDPPYNTGAKDWKYNNDFVDKQDLYRHSKWISFMDVRLRLARKLLKPDGALITTIDDNEFANVYLLIKEIFPECKHTIITVQMNPGGTQGKAFSVTNEYAIISYFDSTPIYRKKHVGDDTYNLRRWGSTSNRYEGATCFYPVIVDENNTVIGFGKVLDDDIHPSAQVEMNPDGTKNVWPIDVSGIEKKWRYARDTVEEIISRLSVERKGDRLEIIVKRETEPPKTVWVNNEYNSESFGTKFIKSVIGENRFTYPKSLYAVKDSLSMIVAGKPDAVVLDFFAGSGTTLNALNLINAEDGGHRKCIMVTNNEVSDEYAKELKKDGLIEGTKEWEEKGISRHVTWPRSKYTINGFRDDGSVLKGEYITSKYVEKREPRKVVKIPYINPLELNLTQKKQLISLIAKGKIPQSYVGKDSKYLMSEDEKYTVSLLLDDAYADEWLKLLEEKEHITEFYVFTKDNKLFKSIQSRIEELLGDIVTYENVGRPLSLGFDANLKYLKCDWTPRKPENYLLSNALCLHIKEMIELQNFIEVDGEKNVLVLNKHDLRRSILDPVQFNKIENVWLNQNIILNSEEMKLLKKKGFKYIPREFFGQELREVAE